MAAAVGGAAPQQQRLASAKTSGPAPGLSREATPARDGGARYQALVEAAPDVIYTLAPDGTIRTLNPAFETITGWSRAAWLGRPFAPLVHPDDVPLATECFGRVLGGETLRGVELRILSRSGEYVVGEFAKVPEVRDGAVAGVLGIGRDITGRRRVEAALRESEARYRLLVDTATDVIFTVSADGTISSLNPAFETIMGWSRAAWLGKPFGPLIHRDDVPVVMERFGRVLAGETLRGLEVRILTKSGDYMVCEYSVAPQIRDGVVVGALGVARDVTERKRAEAALRESEERLQDLVGRLLLAQEEERRRVAYEVHDGLAQVAAAAQQHLESFASHYTPRAAQARQELEQALDLARRTVAEARRVIAGLRPTVLDDFGLEAAIRLEVEALRREGWQISYTAALGTQRLPPIIETALFRVAQEALTNVRKHARTTRAHVALQRCRGALRLEVRDWGRGFQPSEVHPAGPGERVGIAGMRERMVLLGGRCTVRSRPGGGTRVLVEVPLPPPATTGGGDGQV